MELIDKYFSLKEIKSNLDKDKIKNFKFDEYTHKYYRYYLMKKFSHDFVNYGATSGYEEDKKHREKLEIIISLLNIIDYRDFEKNIKKFKDLYNFKHLNNVLIMCIDAISKILRLL